uniref:Uncharacterized protein n=1 Tax=Timema poppense TaxID=170557 RepID=A0A7R9HFB4_TIMPO|nr:unnamed protein product [Timema poppensis]
MVERNKRASDWLTILLQQKSGRGLPGKLSAQPSVITPCVLHSSTGGTKQGDSLTFTGYTMVLSYKLHHSGTKQGDSLTLTGYTMALSYKIHHSGTEQDLGNVSPEFPLEDSLVVAFLNPELVELSEEIANLFKSNL